MSRHPALILVILTAMVGISTSNDSGTLDSGAVPGIKSRFGPVANYSHTMPDSEALLVLYQVILSPFTDLTGRDFGNIFGSVTCPSDAPYDPTTMTCGAVVATVETPAELD